MQTTRRSVEHANTIVDVINNNYTTVLRYYTRDTVTWHLFIYAAPKRYTQKLKLKT